jgi:hypothetical protein
MNKNLQQLQEFLDQHEIPKSKKRPKTFLGIARQPHYENVLSNMYAFFFDENEVHGFGDLFTLSLMQIVEQDIENNKRFQDNPKELTLFNNFSTSTEVSIGGKLIDLLLDNGEQAIIVENKIYHHLNNPLDIYWRILNYHNKNKIGIILSLNRIEHIEHEHFINITHLELMKSVMNNLGNYIMGGSSKYLIFIKDLNQNIINLSTRIMKSSDISFYFKNQNEIDELIKFKESYKKHIISQIGLAGKKMQGVALKMFKRGSNSRDSYCYYINEKEKNLMYTIIYKEMWNRSPQLLIVVELMHNAVKNLDSYRNIEWTDEDLELIGDGFDPVKVHFTHFAKVFFEPNEAEVLDLSDYILAKIKSSGLGSVFSKLETHLLSIK